MGVTRREEVGAGDLGSLACGAQSGEGDGERERERERETERHGSLEDIVSWFVFWEGDTAQYTASPTCLASLVLIRFLCIMTP